MSFLAPIAQLFGTGVSAAGSLQAGQQQQQIDQMNAQVANQNAAQALQASQVNAQIADQKTTEQLGAAGAAYGAAGVTMSGSPLAVMASLASKGALTKQLALYSGQVQAAGDTNQAAISTAEGKAAMSAATTKATGTLLTGTAQFATSAASMYPGTFGSAGTSPLAA